MSCTSSPTLTSTELVVTSSLSTSTTTHVTTLPPSSTTITIPPTCPSSASACVSLPTVTTSEIPGGTTTSVETVTITVPVTSSLVTTLFGTSCTQSNDTDHNSTPTVTSDSPTPTPTTTSTTTSFSTPPPTIIVTQSSSTQTDGVVTTIMYTETSTPPPVAIQPSATLDANANANHGSDSSQHIGPIIGGTVGGVVGLAVIILLAWLFVRKKRWDDIFDNDDTVPAMALAASSNREKVAASTPKPYQYGLVGYTESQSLTSSPTSRPPISLADEFDSHHRHNSTTPLLGRPVTATSASINSSVSPRPVSAASAQGYDVNAQTASWDPSRLYGEPTQHLLLPTQVAAQPIDVPADVAAVRMGLSDQDHRAESPVSFQERRVLQVMNADLVPLSPATSAPRLSTPTGRTSLDPQRDGKGRLTKGEKAPIVHLDGGRYQQGTVGSSSGSANDTMPPSYSE